MIDKFIQDTVREAGKITLKYFKKAKVEYAKSHELDVVTKADLESNKYIVDTIKAKFPQDGFISEEMGEENAGAENIWIIDPLDGTLNFSKGIPLYCILIAHVNKGVVDRGVIYDPVHGDMLSAKKGMGAFLNGKRIYCSEPQLISSSVGVVNAESDKEHLSVYELLRRSSENNKCWLTNYLSLGISESFVASGKKDWIMSFRVGKVWDYAAGTIVMAEAGCKVTNLKGEPWSLQDDSLVAANPVLHKKLLNAIKV